MSENNVNNHSEEVNQELSNEELKDVAGGFTVKNSDLKRAYKKESQGNDSLLTPTDNTDPGTKTPTSLAKNEKVREG